MIEIDSTMMGGVQAVEAPNGLIAGIVCKIAIIKKKTFATLRN